MENQDPVSQVEAPQTPIPSEAQAVTQDVQQTAQDQEQTDTTKTPEQDFIDSYTTLCSQKGFEFQFEAKPLLEDGIYDFSKIKINIIVAKKA